MPYHRQIKQILLFTLLMAVIALPLFASAAGYTPLENSEVVKALSGDSTAAGGSQWIHDLYRFCKGFVNLIAVVILIIVAFANILHINIETYSVKKMLPSLIIALVLANLAMPIITVLCSIVDKIMVVPIFSPLGTLDQMGYILGGFKDAVLGAMKSAHGWGGLIKSVLIVYAFAKMSGVALLVLIVVVLVIISLFILLIATLILAFRPYIIFLAAAVAPVAIILSVLPQTQQYFKKWLGILLPWIIMPVVMYFLLHIGVRISNTVSASGSITAGTGLVSSIIGFFLPLLIRTGLLLLAIRFPFMIEKDISSVIGKIGNYTGKAAWAGYGGLVNLAYYTRNARSQVKSNTLTTEYEAASMKEGDEGLGGLRQGYIETRKAEIERSAATAKQKQDKKLELTAEEEEALNLKNKGGEEVDKKVNEEADLLFTKDSEELDKKYVNRAQEIEIEIRRTQRRAKQRQSKKERLTREEEEALKLGNDDDAITNKAKERAAKERKIEEVESAGAKAKQYSAVMTRGWENTNPAQRFFMGAMKSNLYGILGTLKERFEFNAQERDKTYGKYSVPASWARGRVLDAKYNQGIVKEDLGELPTAEQMSEYCSYSMKKFYLNVKRALRARGLEVTDEQARIIGNRRLREMRTQVKGTKDYVADPFFRGLSGRDVATVIEGDYNISRQIAIEMRRGDRTVSDRALEQRKLELGGGSGVNKSENVINKEEARRTELRLQQTNTLLERMRREISRGRSVTTAVGGARDLDISSLNPDDFREQNISIVMPAIQKELSTLGVGNIDVKMVLESGHSVDVSRIEDAAMRTGKSSDELHKLLQEYSTNKAAEIATASSFTEGSSQTAETARRLTSSQMNANEMKQAVSNVWEG